MSTENPTAATFFDNPRNRLGLFVLPLLLGLAVFCKSAVTLLLSDSELYSHIPVVYVISGYLIYRDRGTIFQTPHYSPHYGIPVVLAGVVLFIYAHANEAFLGQNDSLSALSFAFILYTTGLFVSTFGAATFRRMIFPVVFLIFAVPIPSFLLGRIIYYLQNMSFYAAAWVLDVVGLFPIREGFVLRLPEISVEVAEQCSGIRSSIALLIVSVLYGQFFLRTYACRCLLIVLSLVVIPFKNGLRITTLVFLAIYWDKAILAGPLHRIGGIPFFIVGLIWLGLVMAVLYKLERVVVKRIGSK